MSVSEPIDEDDEIVVPDAKEYEEFINQIKNSMLLPGSLSWVHDSNDRQIREMEKRRAKKKRESLPEFLTNEEKRIAHKAQALRDGIPKPWGF